MSERLCGDGTLMAADRRPERSKRSVARLVVLGLIALYVILFVILNSRHVKVSFVLFSTRISLLVALILAAALGFVAGFLLSRSRSDGRRS
jgi:uncharacterized integral membrane protein